ncbi:MAG: protease [Acidobacteriota bacterium]
MSRRHAAVFDGIYNPRVTTTTGRHAVALLVEDGFDDRQVTGLIESLTAHVEVVPIGPVAPRTYTGHHGLGTVVSQLTPASARSQTFAVLVIPGGSAPDRLRMRHAVLDMVRDAVAAGCPVAAIGHGAQVLISALVLAGRTVTSWPSIAIDVKNAGGLYVDRPVVEDGGLITSRKADDLPQFVDAILRAVVRRN